MRAVFWLSWSAMSATATLGPWWANADAVARPVWPGPASAAHGSEPAVPRLCQLGISARVLSPQVSAGDEFDGQDHRDGLDGKQGH
jgi:hypothetical protein